MLPLVVEAACWAHVRRKFFELMSNGPAPIAEEALRRIGGLYAVEKGMRGSPPDIRKAERQKRTRPLFDNLQPWLEQQWARVPGKSPLTQATRYAL